MTRSGRSPDRAGPPPTPPALDAVCGTVRRPATAINGHSDLRPQRSTTTAINGRRLAAHPPRSGRPPDRAGPPTTPPVLDAVCGTVRRPATAINGRSDQRPQRSTTTAINGRRPAAHPPRSGRSPDRAGLPPTPPIPPAPAGLLTAPARRPPHPFLTPYVARSGDRPQRSTAAVINDHSDQRPPARHPSHPRLTPFVARSGDRPQQ
jgi:hypothetical protein